MPLSPSLTQQRLKELMTYYPDIGLFVRNKGKGRGSPVYTMSLSKMRVDGKFYQARRLAYIYMTGQDLPDGLFLGSSDGDKFNPVWSNMRLMTMAECIQIIGWTNRYRGVQKHGKRWRARIHMNGKETLLGSFFSIEAALSARHQAEKEMGFALPILTV